MYSGIKQELADMFKEKYTDTHTHKDSVFPNPASLAIWPACVSRGAKAACLFTVSQPCSSNIIMIVPVPAVNAEEDLMTVYLKFIQL